MTAKATHNPGSVPGMIFIPSSVIRSAGLSMRALGLYGYLAARPAGEPASLAEIAGSGPDGDEAVRSALPELEAAGLAVITAAGVALVADESRS